MLRKPFHTSIKFTGACTTQEKLVCRKKFRNKTGIFLNANRYYSRFYIVAPVQSRFEIGGRQLADVNDCILFSILHPALVVVSCC